MVLESLRKQTGIDNQKKIDALLLELVQATSSPIIPETNLLALSPDGDAKSAPIKVPDPSSNPKLRDHLFISYSHVQKELVDKLRQDLEKRGHIVWVDYTGIPLLTEWPQEIVDAIYWLSAILLCLSPEAVKSEWVNRECKLAQQYGKTIFPLVLSKINNLEEVLQQFGLNPIHQSGDLANNYDFTLEQLIGSPNMPIPLRVLRHCGQVAEHLELGTWDPDVGYYIAEQAQTLPMNARLGDRKGHQVDLVEYLQSKEAASLRAIVLGQTGSGKSIALGRLAWVLSTKSNPDIAVLIRLSGYEKGSLVAQIHARLNETHQLPQDVDAILKSYKGYFLLDGLNEAPEILRYELINEIEVLDRLYPRFRLIISSRIQGESWQRLREKSTYITLLIQEIQPEDVQSYLRSHLGSEYAETLWASLNPNLRELVRTPLILKLIKDIALVNKDVGQSGLPKNRGELYAAVVQELLTVGAS